MKGVGVDLVETARFARSTNEFARLVLTDKEFDEWFNRKRDIMYLATRFAAKEAGIKALGYPIGFQLMQVTNDARGKPELQFLIDDLKIKNVMLSLSDAKDYVVAMVILE